MSSRRQSPTWQQNLAQAREMRGQAGASLFDRLKLLNAVFEDADWRVRTGKTDEGQWLDMLDEEVADAFLPFAELRDMLLYAPERAQWSDGKLTELRAKMHEDRRRQRSESAAPQPQRKRVTADDLKAVEREKAQSKALYLDGECKSLQERLKELEVENRRLTRELAKAEGRISELERMVKGELAAA